MQSIRKIRDSQRRETMHWRWHPESSWRLMDSDDYIGQDFLKKMYDTAIEQKSDMVMCNYTKVTEQGEIFRSMRSIIRKKGFGFRRIFAVTVWFEDSCLTPGRSVSGKV